MDRLYEQLRVRSLNSGKKDRESYVTREGQTTPKKTVSFKEGSKKFEEEQGKISSQNAAPVVKTPSLKAESGKLNFTSSGDTDTEAGAWEKAELAKIQKRYEKMYSSIVAWESKKKTKARRRLEQNEAELQQERARAVKEYNEELTNVNKIAAGARSVADEKNKKDESKIKKKANKIKSTGEIPRSCFLF